ncbi:MAG TPA: hypothetical protein VHF89_04270 [Solirubrobacteraceae bacterium]|nr:hypothetical protein [Solirubrobacteraceae bacterium]
MLRRLVHRRSPVAVLAAAALASLAAPAQADLTGTEELALDSYAAVDTPPTVGTSDVLSAGRYYVATVSGTFTYFSRSRWQRGTPHCGSPDPAPLDPSPGRPFAPAGDDAELSFGAPRENNKCPNLPAHSSGVRIDTGDDFKDLDPRDGPVTTPAQDHTYRYLLRGAGRAARFRILDTGFGDNSGILSISVRPALRADCGNDGACASATPDEPVPPEEKPELPDEKARLIQAPSTRVCLSRRRFPIHILRPRFNPLVNVAVTVAGRSVRVRKARRRGKIRYFGAIVDLRGKPRGRYEVRIVTRARDGQLRKAVRRYRTCS